MNHAAFFNGIGGFQLAAEWMGWENVMSCEIDPFCNQVTKYYWPNCIQHEDIRATDFSIYRGRIDIISGGFPCQPYSTAGKRLGKEDERHLWPEMRRGIREIQPAFVVGENVRGLLSWNGGLVFDEVQSDLEAEGYEVVPFLLPACGVNAPHRRDRIWFVAHALLGNKQRNRIRKAERQGFAARQNSGIDYWDNFPTQPPICGRNDGLPARLDGITFSKWRNESIKAYGNAIVPELAYQIFKAIQSTKNK